MKKTTIMTTALILAGTLSAAFASTPINPSTKGYSVGLATFHSSQAVKVQAVYTKHPATIGQLKRGQAFQLNRKIYPSKIIVTSTANGLTETFNTAAIPTMNKGFGTWNIQDLSDHGLLVNINTGHVIHANS